MIKYVEFKGLSDKGVRDFGRIILKNGKLRAEGDKLLKKFLRNDVRDLRPEGNQEWVSGKDNPELFLRILPYYYCGTYLCASRVVIDEGG